MQRTPVILLVEDDPEERAALHDALARRYGADYRVISHGSPHPALDELRRLPDSHVPVALVIAGTGLAPHCGELAARWAFAIAV